MRKLLFLFGLISSLTFASNIVVENDLNNSQKEKSTLVLEINFEKAEAPNGTCTIYEYGNGYDNPPTNVWVYYNVSYEECKRLA